MVNPSFLHTPLGPLQIPMVRFSRRVLILLFLGLLIPAVLAAKPRRTRVGTTDRCEACRNLVRSLNEDTIPRLKDMRARAAELRAAGAHSARTSKGEIAEFLEDAVSRGCQSAQVQSRPAQIAACEDLLLASTDDVVAFLSSWTTAKDVYEANPRAGLKTMDGLSEEAKMIYMVDLIESSQWLARELCANTLNVCKLEDLPEVDAQSEIARVQQTYDQQTQHVPHVRFPPDVNPGEPHILVGATIFPFLLGHDGANTEHRELLLYYAAPQGECFRDPAIGFTSAPTAASERMACAEDPDAAEDGVHEALYPTVRVLARLAKGFTEPVIGVINVRANQMPAPLDTVHGSALSYHPVGRKHTPKMALRLHGGRSSVRELAGTFRDTASPAVWSWVELALGAAEELGHGALFAEWHDAGFWAKAENEAKLDRVWRRMVNAAAEKGLTNAFLGSAEADEGDYVPKPAEARKVDTSKIGKENKDEL